MKKILITLTLMLFAGMVSAQTFGSTEMATLYDGTQKFAGLEYVGYSAEVVHIESLSDGNAVISIRYALFGAKKAVISFYENTDVPYARTVSTATVDDRQLTGIIYLKRPQRTADTLVSSVEIHDDSKVVFLRVRQVVFNTVQKDNGAKKKVVVVQPTQNLKTM